LLLLGLLFLTRHRRLLLIACFAVTITATPVLTWYLPFFNNQIKEKSNLSILIYNINVNNRNYEQVLAMIRKEKPNISILMEVNQVGRQNLNVLEDTFSYSIRPQNFSNHSIIIYSQLPLEKPSTHLYERSDRLILSADLRVKKRLIHLMATHLTMPLNSFQSRNQELDQLGNYVQSLDSSVILAGDLNITMWSPYYRRLVKETGLKNTRQGLGIIPTWPAKKTHPLIVPKLASIPIDHCLTTPDIQVKKIYVGKNAGSDHFPLIVDLLIPETSI
jgi:endonuclease/exonuclease/phosphatase (EEP) superfamily protein YafD